MKILLMMVLFNVHTGAISGASVVASYNSADSCLEAVIHTGAQHPDLNGEIKLYTCAIPQTQL